MTAHARPSPRTLRSMAVLVTFLVVSGPGSAERAEAAAPGWAHSGKSAKLPTSQYIIGVGEGDSRADAIDRARAEIAAQFEVRVQSQTSVAVSSSHRKDASGESLVLTEDVENVTRTFTDRTMKGVSIPETWLDPDTASHHALAVLSRATVARGLTTRLAEDDKSMALAMAEAAAAKSAIGALRAWIRALKHHERRSVLRAQLGVVDRGAWAKTATKVEQSKLRSQIRKRLGALDARVTITPAAAASGAKLAHALRRAITAFGLKIRSDGAKTAIRIDVELDEGAEPKSHPKFHFWRMEARVQVHDRFSGSTVGAATFEAREGALSMAAAKGRAQMRITDDLIADFAGRLRQMLTGEAPGDGTAR